MAEENTILCFVLIISVFHSVTLQEFEGFVVEGDFAKMKDFPHAALLYIECRESSDNPTRYFTCGSSIINQDIVLTAAHCLENCAAKFTIVTVHVGNREKKKGLPIKASGFKTHGKYNPRTISNDIALVKLKNRLVFGKKVRRVALMREPPYDETAEVAGWGWLNEDPRTESKYLMQASQKVWSRQSCMEIMGHIPEGTICGGALDAQSYVAPGDSGSGLIVRKYIQIGIVSYKVPSKSPRLAMYTDVAYFYNWIEKNSKKLYCS
ncbi:hypothetical protein MSG28_002479 [Choristoneura fumiferana]|uniref:Uncharacterized protein n=1 Tax=Choristoneura fumiferana TaxID=7141 RepID=A0ACC0JVP0_CHOFU|nr:hypothetical protein MSG28_002479 [Choristoneura fumiferana]